MTLSYAPTLAELPPPSSPSQTGWPWTLERQRPETMPTGQLWPKISIVTPSYNQGPFIEETIRSVLLQGYPNFEYIIIDGGSTDNTLELIRKYEPWLTYWTSEPDEGQAQAINKGFQHATGSWLAWLNSDDLYLPNALWRVAQTVNEHPDSHWMVGVTVLTDAALNPYGHQSPTTRHPALSDPNWVAGSWLDHVCTLHSGIFLPQQSSFWSQSAYRATGALDEKLYYTMDYDHWTKLAYHGFLPTIIEEELALFRMHSTQKTADQALPFLIDELYVIDKWLAQLSGEEHKTLVAYRSWLQKHIRWQKIKRSPAATALISFLKSSLHSTRLSQRLFQQVKALRPGWMFFQN